MNLEMPPKHRFEKSDFTLLIRGLTGIIFTTLVSACLPMSPTVMQDRELFERLCNASDRDFIKRKVTADGYANASLISETIPCPSASLMPEVFTEMGYQYYECALGPWLDGNNPDIVTYRFSLEQKGAPACQGDSERVVNANKALDVWRRKHNGFEDNCIGVAEQKLPRSRYIKLDDYGRVMPDGTHKSGKASGWRSIPGYISYSRARVLDRNRNEFIAERKFYFYYPAGPQYSDLKKDQCEVIKTWRISDVIKPSDSDN